MKSLCSGLLGSLVVGAFVLQFPASAQAREKTVYSFCSQTNCTDGAKPFASLVDVKGTLYGTTNSGGANSGGTVFSLDPGTGAETVLYSFCSQTNCADGLSPSPGPGLIDVHGLLYGTTIYGGSHNYGTIFSVDPGTGAETVLYSFCSQAHCTDGANPDSGLIDVNGTLYGTALENGSNGNGTLFSFNLRTGVLTVLHSFCSQADCADGAYPGALIDVNGTLYGTTSGGGSTGCGGFGCGTVFSFDPGTETETVLYAFRGGTGDGSSPSSSSLLDINGLLYSTTGEGGGTGCVYRKLPRGCGTVFSLDPGTGAETVLYGFCNQANCADGAKPFRGLIDVNGTLYGTTYMGGAHIRHGGAGTVFSFDPGTGTQTVLYSFCSRGAHCKDGENPGTGLLEMKGQLYGGTFSGGMYGGGTVFSLKTP